MYLLTSVCVVASKLESWLDKTTDRLPFHILASRNLCCGSEFQLCVPGLLPFQKCSCLHLLPLDLDI